MDLNSTVAIEATSKLLVLVPPPLKRSVPVSASTLPSLLKITSMSNTPVATVLLNVPVLLNCVTGVWLL